MTGFASVRRRSYGQTARLPVRSRLSFLDRAGHLGHTFAGLVPRLPEARAGRVAELAGGAPEGRGGEKILVEATQLLVALRTCLCAQHITGAEPNEESKPSTHGRSSSPRSGMNCHRIARSGAAPIDKVALRMWPGRPSSNSISLHGGARLFRGS